MLNIEKCKKLLQQDGKTYTDEQVKQIREALYKMANLEYHLLTDFKKLKNADSNHLHQGVHRRAS
jgi:hypothetical protein